MYRIIRGIGAVYSQRSGDLCWSEVGIVIACWQRSSFCWFTLLQRFGAGPEFGSIEGQREKAGLICVKELLSDELLAVCEFGEESFADLFWSLLMETGGLMECADAWCRDGSAGFEEIPCRLPGYAGHFWIILCCLDSSFGRVWRTISTLSMAR